MGIALYEIEATIFTQHRAADTVEQEATVLRRTCPRCNSAQVRRSRRHAIERILLPFASACRCNECGRRFYSIARDLRRLHDDEDTVMIHRIQRPRTASIPEKQIL